VDATTVRSWLEGLGLQAWTRTGSAGEEVTFGLQGSTEQPGLVRWNGPARMGVQHTRHLSTAELATSWRDPSNVATPSAELRTAVAFVAERFPLVVGDVSEDQTGAVVTFSAVVFDEQLCRQAFALTVSSLVKAAAMFDAGAQARAQQLATLTTMQTR
jgi:hypothetical protein